MTRRVLIVSPHFPPVNTADMHRVRMLLPFFRENGWIAEVLAVSPDHVEAPRDPWLLRGLPRELVVHRVQTLGLRWTRIPGLGTLGLRALRPLARAGDLILANGGFDLVYFSTTVFEVHLLGARWRRRLGVPFVMDYQDPWVNDYYREHPDIVPPGGRLKYLLAGSLHRWMEPRVLRACAGLTCVSPDYPKRLVERYPWTDALPCLVEAFPGARRDFELLGSVGQTQQCFDPRDGHIHWLYIGRGGGDMATALRGLFASVRQNAPESLSRQLRLHFIGTSYGGAGKRQESVTPIAREYGLEDMVVELPNRIPYSESLRALLDAQALIMPGSDDPSYTASKVYPYLLARRPLLVVFHEQSRVVDLIRHVGGGVCVTFSTPPDLASLAKDIAKAWLADGRFSRLQPLDEAAFHRHTDEVSASVVCRFLWDCIRDG